MSDIESSTVSLRTFIIAVVSAISLSISGTMIYMTLLHSSERIEYTNDRIDKKTARNEELIHDLKNRLESLEERHESDGK